MNGRYSKQEATCSILWNGLLSIATTGALALNLFFGSPTAQAATNTWEETGSMTKARFEFTATLLKNGKVLATGGGTSGWAGRTATAETYDPGSGRWAAIASMNSPRQGHQAILLANGNVLVSGGYDSNNNILFSAEIYDTKDMVENNFPELCQRRPAHG